MADLPTSSNLRAGVTGPYADQDHAPPAEDHTTTSGSGPETPGAKSRDMASGDGNTPTATLFHLD